MHSSIHKRVNVNDVRKLLGILFFQGILLFFKFPYRKNRFFFTLANYILFGPGIFLIFLKTLNVDWSLKNSEYLATTYGIFESCNNPNRQNLEYFDSSSLLLHIESCIWEIIVYSMLFAIKNYSLLNVTYMKCALSSKSFNNTISYNFNSYAIVVCKFLLTCVHKKLWLKKHQSVVLQLQHEHFGGIYRLRYPRHRHVVTGDDTQIRDGFRTSAKRVEETRWILDRKLVHPNQGRPHHHQQGKYHQSITHFHHRCQML